MVVKVGVMDISTNNVNWDAMMRARYRYMAINNVRPGTPWIEGYQIWMHETWGIDHYTTRIDIVDEQKYALFLLRFA